MLASLEFYDATNPNTDEMIANVYSTHVPRIGETVSILLVSKGGYQKYKVVDIEYLFDATYRQTRLGPDITQVAVMIEKNKDD